MTTALDKARAIREAARENGVHLTHSDGVARVTVTFTPGDKAAYVAAENACLAVLRLIPAPRPGSTWGTDSGSVGGAIGLEGGYCNLSKSGCNKNVLNALNKVG